MIRTPHVIHATNRAPLAIIFAMIAAPQAIILAMMLLATLAMAPRLMLAFLMTLGDFVMTRVSARPGRAL